jgi:hypothetical protein
MSNANDFTNNPAQPNNQQCEEHGAGENLEDLVAILHRQIKTSGWLEVNNAESFEKANPDLAKAWNDEILKAQQQTHSDSA